MIGAGYAPHRPLFVLFIAVLLGALYGALILVPAERITALVAGPVERATGLNVRLSGRLSPTLYPTISVPTGPIVVSRPDWEGGALMQADGVRVGLDLIPLVQGDVSIAEVTLINPIVRLDVNEAGEQSWAISPQGAQSRETVAAVAEAPASEANVVTVETAEGTATTPVSRIVAGIEDGQVFYTDATTGTAIRLDAVNLRVDMDAADAPPAIDAGLEWNGQTFALEGSVTSLQSLIEAQAGSARLELESSLGGGSVEMVLRALTEGLPDLDATLTFAMADPNQSLIALGLPPVPEAAGRLENLALDLVLQSAPDAANAALTARVVRDDIATSLVSHVAVPVDVLTARTAKLDALIEADGVLEARFQGEVGAPNLGPMAEGALSATSGDVAGLLAWAGVAGVPAEGQALEQMELTTRLAYSGPNGCGGLCDLSFALDDMTLTGAACAVLDGERPRIVADLAVGVLDLTPFVGAEEGAEGEEPVASASADADAAPAGWPEDPLPWDLLDLADADIALGAEGLIAGGLTTGPLRLTVDLEAGDLGLTARAEAFDGVADLEAALNGPEQTAALDLDLSGVQIGSVLELVSGTESLLVATGAADAALTTTGASVADLVGALDGTIGFDLNDGHVRRVNLTAIINLLDGEPRADARTDFSAATAAFSVSDGVMVTEDMRVAAPFFRLEGQGGRAGSAGLALPVRISGLWTALSFVPAPGALDALRDASEEAAEAARDAADAAAARAEEETRDAVEGAAEEVRDALRDRRFNR